MAAKQRVDWDAVEPEYRAGIKSLRQLAEEFGCSSGRIAQAAKERGWERDLTEKIKAKAKAKLNKLILSDEAKQQREYSESEVIDANSDRIVSIQLSHRKDIGRARKLAMSLLEELEGVTNNPEFIQRLAEIIDSQLEEDVGQKAADKLMEAFHKASSLPGRVGTMKMLSETLKNLVGLEREAFGIESKTPIDDALKASGIQVSFIAANGPK